MFKYIGPDFSGKRRCFFCGERKSVKYMMSICDQETGQKRNILCCNVCVLLHSEDEYND